MTIKDIVFRLVLFVTVALSVAPGTSHAFATQQPHLSSQSCDVDYFNVLQNHGRLEGERRLMIAGSMIIKPDSVLDYTCFGNFMDAQRSPYFSTSYVLFSEIHGGLCFENSLHCSLTTLVLDTLAAYVSNNFPDTMLGGRGTLTRVRRDPGMCNMMYRVWDEAKCFNFQSGYREVADGEDLEGFHSFAEMTSLEPRQLPSPCGARISPELIQATFPAPVGASTFYDNLTQAAAAVSGQIDMVTRPYNEENECAPPILTGLDSAPSTMFMIFNNSWPDAVCPNPGCVLSTDNECVPVDFE